MREVVKYNVNDYLVEVVELNYTGGTETMFSFDGSTLIKYWNQEEGEYVEYSKYDEPSKLISLRSDGEKWTRLIKDEEGIINFPRAKEKIGLNNGEIETFKVKDNLLKLWKKKI